MTTNEIGRVIGVHGFHVRVELDSSQKSPVRADLEGVETQIKINAFVTFEIGAGESILGIVTDLDAREVFEPDDRELTLELAKPRRVASVQLLGTIATKPEANTYRFDPGVNVLPTLDTPAIPARREILATVLTESPRRNLPPADEESGEKVLAASRQEYDGKLLIGVATAATDRQVFGSFNDLFSRPLAVVGNTGSGKSCTIAHLLQTAIVASASGRPQLKRPRFFLLDINGEYASAFNVVKPKGGRQPNRLYVNGQEFSVPVWLMNASEACVWLNAAEQTQQPALVNLWAISKGDSGLRKKDFAALHHARTQLSAIFASLDDPNAKKKGVECAQSWEALKSYLPSIKSDAETVAYAKVVDDLLRNAPSSSSPDSWNFYGKSFGSHDKELRDAVIGICDIFDSKMAMMPMMIEQTADKPLYFDIARLDDPSALEAAAAVGPGERSMAQFLQGLQLRIQNRRTDKRWHCFYNYGGKDGELNISNATDWFKRLGIGAGESSPFTVIDCSMLSHEVLPYVCGIIGRMLLDLREHAEANRRFHEPWVVVLEEAHNYVRPPRQDEPRGIKVSRETFERIAKEGRKFGLSLIVASQRPSEISQTVLSQCANFVAHRLQNPDDIDHFRKIVPSQTRRLLDQITILRAGEAIVLGSAFYVPSRVQIELPAPEPSSRSSMPFFSWRAADEKFDSSQALTSWLGEVKVVSTVPPTPAQAAPAGSSAYEASDPSDLW